MTAEELARGRELLAILNSDQPCPRSIHHHLAHDICQWLYGHREELLAAAERAGSLRESTAKWADAASKAETACMALIVERDSLRAECESLRQALDEYKAAMDIEVAQHDSADTQLAAAQRELELLREFHTYACEKWSCFGGPGNAPCRLNDSDDPEEFCMAHYAWNVRDALDALRAKSHDPAE